MSPSKISRCLIILYGIMMILLLPIGYSSGGWASDPRKLSGTGDRHPVLVLGKVTENPKKQYRYMKPIVDYVAGKMADLGIRESKVLMAKDNRQMISYLRQGKVDWLTETVFSAALISHKTGAEILLRKWKKGVPDYYSIFFVRKDSGIETLSDIRGKTIAFEDMGSTSAYFIPASILLRAGFQLVQLNSVREKAPPNMIGYVFSGQELTSASWVYRGMVDVGALNNLDWEKEDHVRKVYRKDMKIIHQSRRFPRAIELVRKDLDPQVKQRLKEILLDAHNDPNAEYALKAYQKTKKFDELDEDGWRAVDDCRDIIKVIQTELE